MKCDIIAIIQLIAPNNCRFLWASCSSCFSSFAILSLSNSSYFFLALSWAFINSLILLADAFSALSNFVVLFFFGKMFTVIRTRRYWVAEWWPRVYYGAADSGGRSCGVAESGGAAESNDRSCRSADSSGSCGRLTVVAGAVEKLDATLWISQLFFFTFITGTLNYGRTIPCWESRMWTVAMGALPPITTSCSVKNRKLDTSTSS